ncbi:MAG: pilus assembly PilX N-terminal domain-containing protein, partial [Patescibacteria group bacterium]
MNREQGLIGLYLTIVVLILMGGIIASIGFGVLMQLRMIRNITQSAQAYFGAEAGVEDAIYRIRTGKQYSPNYEFSIGTAMVEVTISGGNTKTITGNYSGGNVYRSVEGVLSLSAVSPQFFYGVQAGEG